MEKKLIWTSLSRAVQDLYLTLLWQDGYSEKAIADFLSATKGRIVRRRADLKLANVDRPRGRKEVVPERLKDLLDLHAMREMEAKGVAAIAPVTAPDVTCQWPLATITRKHPTLCGKPAVPGHRLCEEHLEKAGIKRPS